MINLIIQNHNAGFSRLTERKFTRKSKTYSKRIQNEKPYSKSIYDNSDDNMPVDDNNDMQHVTGDFRGANRILEV